MTGAAPQDTDPTPPILRRILRSADHRLVWWLLANQTAKGSGVVGVGWRARAAKELSLPDSQIFRSQERLKRARVIEGVKWGKEIRILPDAFNL